PHDKEIEQVGVRGIYLGNFIPWDTKIQHEKMIKKFNYETYPQQRTFDLYNHVDCVHYTGLHDYIKYLKYGYGKITDHVSREIRWGRLARNKGIKLVQSYQNIIPKDIRLFTQWLGISEKELFDTIDKFRDPRIWEKKEDSWNLKDSVLNHIHNEDEHIKSIKTSSTCKFEKTPLKDPSKKEDCYTLLEKGYVL
ncbi:MAG: N-acetyl sugar amidotransferase, partial [Campylobacterota bacterium]|nr:N-acetyl sugar amidotransferase [Campylobacterota bacterium]